VSSSRFSLYRVRHQNPDKSNNFFKQNVFNEKLDITKNPFIWNLGDHNYRVQLFDISPISLNDGLYSRSEAFARCNVALSMPTNTASIAVLNDIIIGMPKLVCVSFNYVSCSSPRDLNLDCWTCQNSLNQNISMLSESQF